MFFFITYHYYKFSVSRLIFHFGWAVEQLFHCSRFSYQPISSNSPPGGGEHLREARLGQLHEAK